MTTLEVNSARPPTEAASEAASELLDRFADRIEVNPALDRTLVSFQANRETPVYRWFKYKEGFSAGLVSYLLDAVGCDRGVLLDPFAGSGAALFAARERGWDTVGIEVLPVGCQAIAARLAAEEVNHRLFEEAVANCRGVSFADHWDARFAFGHVGITHGAFSPATERSLAGYLGYCRKAIRDRRVRTLMEFAAFCILEAVSYTRKDGQYLRWDHRSNRSRGSKEFDKGKIPSFDSAVRGKLSDMLADLRIASAFRLSAPRGGVDLRKGSCLTILPTLPSQSVDVVLTSPPYCNRYDYTRTYALELAFIGCGEEEIRRLRQEMLSCTVENAEKVSEIRACYDRLGREKDWVAADGAFHRQETLQEVLGSLEWLKSRNKLNNQNIARMVRNYFYEMTFVILEISRVLRRGGSVIIVNDNVRYTGQEIPVDLILCDLAEQFGMTVRHIWTLARGKGNSSQQMGNHGRSELRKCVYVWQKA